jgi:endonuclease YncB( thermonuclease family)
VTLFIADGTRGIKISDGDTTTIADGHYVRYIGIDVPELYPEPGAYGREAWLANRTLVENRPVHLEQDISDTDCYGRQLCYGYVGGVFVNA